VLLLDSISVGFVLPSSVNGWLRFALPGALLAVSVIRMIQWIRMRGVELTPEEAYRFLARMRILSAALPAGFLIWTLALIEVVDPALRAPISLLVFMGCIGAAYCLGIFPAASRLTLLIVRGCRLRCACSLPASRFWFASASISACCWSCSPG
jgi:predicted signal transduction protein with EAL and GGDEF domain